MNKILPISGLVLLATLLTFSLQAQTTLLPFGASWKYLDNGSNQGTSWRGTGFNDTGWDNGLAQLGYGDGDEATVVSYGPNSGAKYITTYFRKVINITDVNAFTDFILNIKRDDGMVVYINGTEVWRNNMPTGTVAYNTLASAAAADNGNTVQTLSLTKAASMLISGSNTIAVEMHQNAGTSSDLSFDFQLQGMAAGTSSVTRGPYLQKLNSSSVTLRWRTSSAVDSRVTYGTSAGNLNLSATVTGTRTEHTVKLTGLSSYTKYYYSIGTTSGIIQAGADNHFTTAPIPGTPGKYTFWVTGDCGNNSTNQTNVLNQFNSYIGNRTTNAWLLLGDNAYSTGTDSEYTTGFFNKYQGTIMKHAPLFPSPGNHDYAQNATRQDDHNIPYYSIFDLPTAGESGGVASSNEAFYSWDYGNIHFLSLDSYGEEADKRMYDTTGAQALWIKQDLAANTKPWVVAYWHHAPYSMTSHNSDTENELVKIRSVFLKMMERLGVDLILCGHSHGYERTKLMKGHFGLESTFNAATHNMSSSTGLYDGSSNSCPYFKDESHTQGGTVYVVAGSSGALGGSQTSYPHSAMQYSNNTNGGSMVLEFDDNRLDAKWLCSDGVVRDKFTIIKNSNKVSTISSTSGQSQTLTASWNGTYVWSTGETTKSITVAPTATTLYTVRDDNSCLLDRITVSVGGAATGSQTYQAEDAAYSGAVVATNQPGYHGTGFIDFVNNTGDYVQWTVNEPSAGKYDLSFRYALPNGGRPLELKVNGTVKDASFDFPATTSWDNWQYVTSTQTLNAGNNTIRLTTNGSNGGNIDELSVIPYLDDCDALANWTSASANTLTYYTADKKQGAGCLQMAGSATDEFKRSFSTPLNSGVSIANGVLSFWYYVSDVTKCGTVRVELGSGGAADVEELGWPLTGLVNGWNHITLNTSDAVQTGGSTNMNALNWFRIYNSKSGSITTRLDAIQISESASGAGFQSLANGKTADKLINNNNLQSNMTASSVTVYPNPYKDGILSIDLTGFETSNNVKIKITNLSGQTVYQKSHVKSSHIELSLAGQLKESLYIIAVEAGGTKVVKKLVVN